MALRACRRCAQQKRRCDHGVPSCQLCKQAGEICAYPSSTRKHGPAVGMSQMYTSRIRELESALNFLMGIPEVMTKVESLVRARGPDCPLPQHLGRELVLRPSTPSISTLGDLVKYAERKSEDRSPSQGQALWASGSSSPVWPSNTISYNRPGDDRTEPDGMQNVGNEMTLETFASVATGPRFDMSSFPTTPVSFSAMLSRAGDQTDPSHDMTQGVEQTQWSDADVQQPAENDSTEELYW